MVSTPVRSEIPELGLPLTFEAKVRETYDTGDEIGHELVEITDAMRQEWKQHGTADLLKTAGVSAEKRKVPG